MLSSIEHEIFSAHNVKMPTIVGILTCMSGKNNKLGLTEPKQAEFLDIFILMSIDPTLSRATRVLATQNQRSLLLRHGEPLFLDLYMMRC